METEPLLVAAEEKKETFTLQNTFQCLSLPNHGHCNLKVSDLSFFLTYSCMQCMLKKETQLLLFTYIHISEIKAPNTNICGFLMALCNSLHFPA